MTFDVYYLDGRLVDDFEELCKQEWASDLIYCDIDGFVISEDGTLMLLDECGNYAYCPKGVFKIIYHINGQDVEQVY